MSTPLARRVGHDGAHTIPITHEAARPIAHDAARDIPDDGAPTIPAVRPQHFRAVLGRLPTGVVAVTAIDPATGEPCGLAINSFTSVSLEPPLVAFCVAHTSTTWPRLRAARSLCVNILAEHQQQVCARLAARGRDKFAGLSWTRSPGGAPVIDESPAWIDCTIADEHPAGDHMIIVARVNRLGSHEDGGPLVFFRGGYGGFRP